MKHIFYIIILFNCMETLNDSVDTSIAIPPTRPSEWDDTPTEFTDPEFREKYMKEVSDYLRVRGLDAYKDRYASFSLTIYVVSEGLYEVPNDFTDELLEHFYTGWSFVSINPILVQLGAWVKDVEICRIKSPYEQQASLGSTFFPHSDDFLYGTEAEVELSPILIFRASTSDLSTPTGGTPTVAPTDWSLTPPTLSVGEELYISLRAARGDFFMASAWTTPVTITDSPISNTSIDTSTSQENGEILYTMTLNFSNGTSEQVYFTSPSDEREIYGFETAADNDSTYCSRSGNITSTQAEYRAIFSIPPEDVNYSVALLRKLVHRMRADHGRNVIAHEMGHNFGLTHTNQSYGSPCSYADDTGRNMHTPVVSTSYKFSTCEAAIARAYTACWIGDHESFNCPKYDTNVVRYEDPPKEKLERGLQYIGETFKPIGCYQTFNFDPVTRKIQYPKGITLDRRNTSLTTFKKYSEMLPESYCDWGYIDFILARYNWEESDYQKSIEENEEKDRLWNITNFLKDHYGGTAKLFCSKNAHVNIGRPYYTYCNTTTGEYDPLLDDNRMLILEVPEDNLKKVRYQRSDITPEECQKAEGSAPDRCFYIDSYHKGNHIISQPDCTKLMINNLENANGRSNIFTSNIDCDPIKIDLE